MNIRWEINRWYEKLNPVGYMLRNQRMRHCPVRPFGERCDREPKTPDPNSLKELEFHARIHDICTACWKRIELETPSEAPTVLAYAFGKVERYEIPHEQAEELEQRRMIQRDQYPPDLLDEDIGIGWWLEWKTGEETRRLHSQISVTLRLRERERNCSLRS